MFPLSIRRTAQILMLMAIPLLTACGTEEMAPSPSITYHYHGDHELLAANNEATIFCADYSSTVTMATISGYSWIRVAQFKCVAASASQTDDFNIDMSHLFEGDHGLLDVAGNASRHCARHGFQQVSSIISMDEDGHKFVTFECTRKDPIRIEAMNK